MERNISELLNDQINKEFYSGYLYLDMANFYSAKGLDGFANWFEIQAQEEQAHAMLFYKYMLNNSEAVTLDAINKPDKEYVELIDPLKAAYEHEQYVTSLIHNLYAEAQKVNDYRTVQFLDWFVKEQGEEEKNTSDLLTKMEIFGCDGKGLYMLDSELKSRVFNPPSLVL